MKWRIAAAAIVVLSLGLFCSYPSMNNQAQAKSEEKITVLNPLGAPPPIKLKNMAPRLDTLDGKTIYIVDDGFVGGINLLQEIEVWFKANYPKTNIVLKRKGGNAFDAEDPQLWAEIKEKGNAVIIGMGH
jgi:hypothetical protein